MKRLCHAGLICVLAAICCTGCQPRSPAPTTRPSGSLSTLPGDVGPTSCDARLHDISGALLAYYAIQGRMPDSLEQLAAATTDMKLELVCPASNKPYIYNPDGLNVPGKRGLLVVYDAEPAHEGFYLAVAIVPGKDDAAPTTRVIGVEAGLMRQAMGAVSR